MGDVAGQDHPESRGAGGRSSAVSVLPTIRFYQLHGYRGAGFRRLVPGPGAGCKLSARASRRDSTDCSLARSAWDNATPKEPSRRVRYDSCS
jgi:hypothetical protein